MDQMNPEAPDALYTIEITALKDGTFTVEKETGAQEGAEDQVGEGQGATPQTAQSLEEALSIAQDMAGEQDSGNFDAGFGKPEAQAPMIREGE